jgi:hypothetical protein
MSRRLSTLVPLTVLALCAAQAKPASAQGLSFGLSGGSGGWPADKRDAIQRAMDQAVAQYNAEGVFEKRVTANYNAGVPTAQANYDGWIDFGGAINTRVALHEIGHTLGVGTYNRPFDGTPWAPNLAAGKLIKLYEGQGATISTGGTHFWPYGLNYDNEDNPEARVRHVRLLSAMRFDMGIVKDSDGDGLRDDWEQHHFGGLAETGSGDRDGDGITNLDEQASDSDPAKACPLVDGHTYRIVSQVSGLAASASGGGVLLRALSDADTQRFTARYVGGGFFSLRSASGDLLGLPGSDVAAAIPIALGPDAQAPRQEWRVTVSKGANDGYFALLNRETARALDGLDAKDGTVLKQYPLLGNIPQQYWRFDDVTPGATGDAGADADASAGALDAGALDASAPGALPGSDGGVAWLADASTPTGLDAAAPGVRDAGAVPPGFTPTEPADDPRAGCALGGSSKGSGLTQLALLVALGALLRRRRR